MSKPGHGIVSEHEEKKPELILKSVSFKADECIGVGSEMTIVAMQDGKEICFKGSITKLGVEYPKDCSSIKVTELTPKTLEDVMDGLSEEDVQCYPIDDVVGTTQYVCERCGVIRNGINASKEPCGLCGSCVYHILGVKTKVENDHARPRYNETYCNICGSQGPSMLTEDCVHKPGQIFHGMECRRLELTEMYCDICGELAASREEESVCNHTPGSKYLIPGSDHRRIIMVPLAPNAHFKKRQVADEQDS